MSLLWRCLLLVGIVTMFAACGDDDSDSDPQTLTELAASDARFSILVGALQRTGLDVTLNGNGPFTVFAPTNDAFSGVDVNNIGDTELANILRYHVFIGNDFTATKIPDGDTYLGMANATGPGGTNLSARVTKDGANVTINGNINVIIADLEGSNGVIHAIDKVMSPLNIVGHAQANPAFNELVGALGKASGELVDVLSDATKTYTVFAPVNDAFTAIEGVTATLSEDALRDVLLYHVVGGANKQSGDLSNGETFTTVNGEDITINVEGGEVTITDGTGETSRVVLANVQATNGVIHVLNRVLLPE